MLNRQAPEHSNPWSPLGEVPNVLFEERRWGWLRSYVPTHVEQEVGDRVRNLAGYFRYGTEEEVGLMVKR